MLPAKLGKREVGDAPSASATAEFGGFQYRKMKQ